MLKLYGTQRIRGKWPILRKFKDGSQKLIQEIKEYSYEERLKKLKLPCLKYKQTRNDLIQTYTIVHGIDNLNPSHFYKFSTRNTSLKLYKEFAKSTPRTNFLSLRINSTWNSLSHVARTARNTATPKNINWYQIS